jgi:Zn finger protein HypA/HybF involved in hydrogenase expression
MIKKSICQHCKYEFSYNDKRSKGMFCSNKCHGDYFTMKRLKKNTILNRTLRKWIYGNLEQKCKICNLRNKWNDIFLRLQIDHINGDVKDNRIENLRMICPNCHTQTSTWGVNNASDDGRKNMIEGAKILRQIKFGHIK